MKRSFVLPLFILTTFLSFSQTAGNSTNYHFIVEYAENAPTTSNKLQNKHDQTEVITKPIIPYDEIQRSLIYPDNMRITKTEGVVQLRLFISEEGRIDKIIVLNKANKDFITAALNSLNNIIIEPAKDKNGKSIKTSCIIPINFRIEQ